MSIRIFRAGGEVLRRAAGYQKAARGFERAGGSTWSFAAALPGELGEGHVQEIGTAMAGPTSGQALFLIVPWRTPPVSGYRDDGCVRWIGVSSAAAGCLRGFRPGDPVSIYSLLHRFALELTSADRLEVIQFGRPSRSGASRPNMPARVAAVVSRQLRDALSGAGIRSAPSRRRLGEPQKRCRQAKHATKRPSIGPPTRLRAGGRRRKATQEKVASRPLRDSDDLSCSNRIEVCRVAVLGESGADIVGCHEVRLDEMRHLVTLRRYPLDVNRALASDGRGGILHATVFARREALAAAGGYSTRLKFAADTHGGSLKMP